MSIEPFSEERVLAEHEILEYLKVGCANPFVLGRGKLQIYELRVGLILPVSPLDDTPPKIRLVSVSLVTFALIHIPNV